MVGRFRAMIQLVSKLANLFLIDAPPNWTLLCAKVVITSFSLTTFILTFARLLLKMLTSSESSTDANYLPVTFPIHVHVTIISVVGRQLQFHPTRSATCTHFTAAPVSN